MAEEFPKVKEKSDMCKCGKGFFTHGSAIYDYYSCGHAVEKGINGEPDKLVNYESRGYRLSHIKVDIHKTKE